MSHVMKFASKRSFAIFASSFLAILFVPVFLLMASSALDGGDPAPELIVGPETSIPPQDLQVEEISPGDVYIEEHWETADDNPHGCGGGESASESEEPAPPINASAENGLEIRGERGAGVQFGGGEGMRVDGTRGARVQFGGGQGFRVDGANGTAVQFGGGRGVVIGGFRVF